MPDVERHPGVQVPGVEVRESAIAGRGWFTTVDLPARTVVLRLTDDRAGPGARPVDALGTGFPNHSCEPNVGWLDEVTMATMGDVAAGEELVTDYALVVADPDWFLRCHCPSYRCRQMVEGTDWRIPQLQQRYVGWWAPHVRELVDGTGKA